MPVSVSNQTLDAFVAVTTQFLEAMAEVYPSCDETQLLVTQYKLFVSTCGADGHENMIRAFHRQIHPFYDAIMANDLRNLGTGVTLLERVRFTKKWEAADGDTRACILEYVQLLVKYAQTYKILGDMPDKMMQQISGIATAVATDIQNGGSFDLSNIDLTQLGDITTTDLDIGEVMRLANMLSNDASFLKMLK
jgi:hypothetical protein